MFIFSGSIDLHIIGHSNAIELWRKMLGPTKVYHAQFKEPNCLRGMFGISDTRNVAHGSGKNLLLFLKNIHSFLLLAIVVQRQ